MIRFDLANFELPTNYFILPDSVERVYRLQQCSEIPMCNGFQ